jgi:cell division protease FtsH
MSALGYAQHLPEERYLYSTNALMDQMTMALGGRVAEQLVFDRITTGAQNDLERITKTAYAMVTDYGMSDRIGNVSFNLSERDEDAPVFEKPYSDATAQAIDEEAKNIIETARERARSLLEDKHDLLDKMADALLEKEVLGPEELLDILGERPHGEYVDVNGRAKTLARNSHHGERERPSERDGSSSESDVDGHSPETQ